MTNREAIKILERRTTIPDDDASWEEIMEALDLAIKALEEVKGLRLLIDWMIECGFGYDNIPEEYEKYREEISDMGYTEGLIYIAMKEAENEENTDII